MVSQLKNIFCFLVSPAIIDDPFKHVCEQVLWYVVLWSLWWYLFGIDGEYPVAGETEEGRVGVLLTDVVHHLPNGPMHHHLPHTPSTQVLTLPLSCNSHNSVIKLFPIELTILTNL